MRAAGCSRSVARTCCATSTCSKRAAKIQGKRLPHVDVPLLTPGLSSGWLALVTDVDLATARNLIDSMTNEVIVRDHSIQTIVPGPTDGLRRRGPPRTGTERPPLRERRGSERLVRPALIDKVPRDHRQPDSEFRRRRVVAAVTLVVGAVLLGLSLATEPGEGAFYPLTLAVALVWLVRRFPVRSAAPGLRSSSVARCADPCVTPLMVGLAGGRGVRRRGTDRPRHRTAARRRQRRAAARPAGQPGAGASC